MSNNEEEAAVAAASSEMDKKTIEVIQAILRYPISFALHPLEYTKILIQLGHEPIAPRPTRTFFGRPALALPSIFEYLNYVRRNVGIVYMYRGAVPRVTGIFVYSHVHDHVSKKVAYLLNCNESDDELDEGGELDGDRLQNERVLRFFQTTVRNMIAQAAAVVASHPFQVITVRMVAQFLGREAAYNYMLTSVKDIYQESGIFGYFSGLLPRLIGEMLAMLTCSSLTFVVHTYLVRDHELKAYTRAGMGLISSAITYPFLLVSRVMMVNGSGMVASLPPHMPIYDSWTDCWSQLKTQNQLKRGSSIFWRYYTGPVVLRDGKPFAATLRNFQKPVASKY